MRMLLCNLFYSRGDKIRVYRAKRSLGSERYNPLNIGYRSVISSLDALIKDGLIIYELGYKDLSTGEGRVSTMVVSDKLRGWFEAVDWDYQTAELLPEEVVVVRNQSQTKDIIDYVDGPHSIWLRERLKEYNNLLNECDIVVVGKNDLIQAEYSDHCLKRKFVSYEMHDSYEGDLLAFGGRMYGPWCNLNSYQRANIEIDGERTIEVDLEASHINVLYRLITGKPYQGGDPYKLIVDRVIVPRHIVKQMATIMQFTGSIQATTATLENHYREKDIPDTRPTKEIERSKEYVNLKLRLRPSEVIEAYLDKHSEVAHYYLRGKQFGHNIQQIESSFVFEVVQQLTSANIPVLTVYDSFIVQERHKEHLMHIINTTQPVNRNMMTIEDVI